MRVIRWILTVILVGVATAADKPNVVLIMTDDQGYGDVGAHGNEMINTPAMDELYRQSIRLTDFHVSPVCTPTRAALMTGRDAIRTRAWGTTWGRSLPDASFSTIADAFVAGGYKTGFFGKWHLGDNYPFRPSDRGFREILKHGGGGVGQTPDYWGNDYFDDTYFRNGKPEKLKGYCTDIWFDGTLDFIQANQSKPFFVYLSTNAPHAPLNVDPKYSDPYIAKGVPMDMAKFYGMIENIDENLQRLMARLDDWGLAENTILIFMSDNGTAKGVLRSTQKTDSNETWTGYAAGMRGAKGSIYDGGHRVPFFLRYPNGGMTGGRDIDALSAHIDLFPTLVDLCDLRLPSNENLDGISLASLLKGDSNGTTDRAIVLQYNQSSAPPKKWNAAVIRQGWRLVGGKELYSINGDPGQIDDLAEKHPERVVQMRADYEDWWQDVSPQFESYSRIVLGSDRQNPSRLDCFDWLTRTPWNQGHIRSGTQANGAWVVTVERGGEYEIALRRWPEEVDRPIRGTLADGSGESIDCVKARLLIANLDLKKPVGEEDREIVFRVTLEPGDTKLQTWFISQGSKESRGAYYVSVKRISH